MAGLGWIHFSETTRRRVLKVIDLLGEKGTIDELGIGVVRNAFSNEMFNGISTIMTRARYYYTVPYLIIDYLRSSPKIPISRFMNIFESDIMEGLTRTYANPEKEKIIGHTIAKKNIAVNKRIQELVRKPSEIYWGGIRTFGMFKKAHSFAQICQAINQGKYLNKSKDHSGSDKENGDDESGHEKWLDLFDVPYVSNWNKEQIELYPEEAEHFKQRIADTMPGTFLDTLLGTSKYIEEFLNLETFQDIQGTEFYVKLNPYNTKIIKTAIQFWDLLYGAHIRFNILLQNKPNQNNPISYTDDWEDWLVNTINVFDWDDFDKNFLWEIVDKHSRVNWQTRNFINNWIDAMQNKVSVDILDEIVLNQEKQNKKERSKLSPQHTENYSGWVGINRLEYRLQNAQTIVHDISNPSKYIKDA